MVLRFRDTNPFNDASIKLPAVKGAHVLVVSGSFYEDIADELLQGATAHLEKAEVTFEILSVPGAFEIPAAIRMAMESGKYDGYIALGCVIRGETTHYDYVCTESARGLNELALQYMLPIGYGILTVENHEQAMARAEVTKGNKGSDAAHACLTMLATKRLFGLKTQ
jgi:6,7-dimethyl-8-ribityllumazine synthase